MMTQQAALSTSEFISVLRSHAAEIAREARETPDDWRVLIEVNNDGTWAGCGRVTRGTTSMAAHEGQSRVAFIDPRGARSSRGVQTKIDALEDGFYSAEGF